MKILRKTYSFSIPLRGYGNRGAIEKKTYG